MDILIVSLITAVMVYVLHKVMKMYWSRRELPPGPFPLPFIGNLLLFKQRKHLHEILEELSAKHGPVFTVFFGPMPTVIVADPVIGLQAMKKHQFAGRPEIPSTKWIFAPNSTDIYLADYGKEWEALSKVGHSVARKFSTSDALPLVVNETVDRMIAKVSEQSFDSEECFTDLMIAILAEAAFGKKYQFDDEEFLKWKQVMKFNTSGAAIMMIPMLRFVFRQMWKTFMLNVDYQKYFTRKMYARALENYVEGNDSSFCDAIISAQRKADHEKSWIKPYLKLDNIYNSIGDLFTVGIEVTRVTLGWIFIMMCKYPEMQDKMRQEVESVIGDEDPNISHREKCPFVCAFMSETMRFRPTAPNSVPHKTTVDTEVNGYKIGADTMVMFSLYNALHSEKVWKDAKSFNPERFLNKDGTHNPKPNPCFIPFSDGMRCCPGDKLAINIIFLIVCRFLQRTSKIQVIGGVGEDHLNGHMGLSVAWECFEHQLQLSLKQSK